MPYVGKKPADIIATAVDTTTGNFSETLAVTGETTLATHLNMGDSDIIKLGDSADLQIYHSGTNSFITEQGTGSLYISATNLNLRSTALETYLTAVDNGAVTLYYDNASKLATTSTGVTVTGELLANTVDATTLQIGGTSITATATELNYNDITTLGAVTASKTVTADSSGFINFADNQKLRFGAGADLQIYHDASNSIIKDTGTGNLQLYAGLRHQFFNADGSSTYAQFVGDGGAGTEYVQLRYANSTKLATTSTGIDVTGLVKTSNAYQVWLGANVLGSTGGLTSIGANPIVIGTDGTERMRIDSSGNVGIGESNPVAKTHIQGSGTSGQTTASLILENSSSGTAGMDITGSAGSSRLRFLYGGGPSTGTNTLTEAMNIVLEGSNAGNVGIGINPQADFHITDASDVRMLFTSDQTGNTSSDGTFLGLTDGGIFNIRNREATNTIFYTNDTERMRISSNGHVSVGTTDNTYGFNVGGSGSDVRGKFQGSNQYRLGLQNGTNSIVWLGSGGANNFRISNSSGQTRFELDSSGAVTIPLQPAFQAQPASNQLNVANGVTIAFGTERFDQNADFSSSIFTAPVTGKYQFNVAIRADQIDRDANWTRVELLTSNFHYVPSIFDPGVLSTDPAYWFLSFSVIADMDANDTAKVLWGQSGGVDSADIDTQSQFSGYLVA